MKKLFYLLLGTYSLLLFQGCAEESFSSDIEITDYYAPSGLSYAEITNARENAAIKTSAPSVNTNGLVPSYKIEYAKKSDGTMLDASYMDKVSIDNPELIEKNYPEEQWYVYNGDSIKTYSAWDYKYAGRISIADENEFGIGDYYFTISVTITKPDDTELTTTFEDAFHLGVGPGLVTNLLYSPIAQNLIVGDPTKQTTTTPYKITGNPDVTFSLDPDEDLIFDNNGTDEYKLSIDATTGVITLNSNYQTTVNDTIYPTVKVLSEISGEETSFKGDSFLMLVVSNTAVDLPKKTNYFFYPTLQSENKLYGYTLTNALDGGISWRLWTPVDPTDMDTALDEIPESVTGKNKALYTRVTEGTWLPHESYITINAQDLTQYAIGSNISTVFYMKNQYVEYLPDGQTSSDLYVYISTDYTGEDNTSTWTKVNDVLVCQIATSTNPTFTGAPYPGDQNLLSGMTNHGQDSSKNADGKWVRCELNLNDYKTSKTFALKFKIISNYKETYPEGTESLSGTLGRPGNYYVSDIHFKATEE